MRILGIAGSPRRGGNTDILLAELIRGAASKDAETKIVILGDTDYSTCTHCDSCLKTGVCIVQDEMQDIFKEFELADIIVLASPIQFTGITAPMKAMIDRFQSRWVRKYLLKMPPLGDRRERKGFFISVGGRKVKDLFEPALVMMKTFFRILDITYTGELLFPGIDEKGAISQHPEALGQAFLAGQELVGDRLQENNN
ncbi:flavodoxin family protein [Chloroflexota bacterium]